MRTKIQKFKGFVNELYSITSSSLSSGRTKFIDKIMDEPSSAKTPAAGILLRKELEDLEFDELIRITSLPPWAVKEMIKNPDSEMSKKVNKFRVTMNNLKFLKVKAKEGDLRCEYCDKGPLVIYDFNQGDMTPENLSNPKYRFNTKFNPEMEQQQITESRNRGEGRNTIIPIWLCVVTSVTKERKAYHI